MKRMKRLLSLGIAMVLIFTALSAGMVAHAESQDVKASEAFAFIKVNGTNVNLKKCPNDYMAFGVPSKTKVEWELKEGWTLSDAKYYDYDGKYIPFNSGDSVKVPNDGTWGYITAMDGEGNSCAYNVRLFRGKLKLETYTLWAGEKNGYIYIDNLYENVPVVSMKSSNTGVIKVNAKKKINDCFLTAKKPGKSKITVVVKINGENKSLSATFTVKKYPKALSSLKVAGKKVNFKKKPFSYTAKTKKAKITFKVAKGWKLSGASYYDASKDKYVSIKSGTTVKVPKKGTEIMFFLTNKKKEVFAYWVNLKR
jgi:hypothetical protein